MLAVLMLVLQTIVPTTTLAVHPAFLPALVAASCTKPNADAAPINPVRPQLLQSQMPKQKVSVEVVVAVNVNGKVTNATVYKSSGNAAIDNAVLTAAKKSRYSPKMVNCVAVRGTFLFKADFAP